MLLISLTMIILSILFLLLIILNLISKKSFSDREKASPYECGFDPLTPPRLPFSLHFFLIAIIFLIFDIELALLLPIILALKISNILNLALFTIIFIYILLIGLYHEWHQGALSWVS